ncbi:MAG: hypothetical protein NTY02_19180 [Acidobacteria bacterium]|nr:hypothetical protein [Acidobacteriota bacterium]
MRYVLPAVVLMGVLMTAGVWGYTQAVTPRPVTPVVISGTDIGFRVVARSGEKAVGQLVVRVDGQWVEAEFVPGVKPAFIK